MMLNGYIDDTELAVDPEDNAPDIFVYGGYFIQQDRVRDLERRISEVKEDYDLPRHAPVKWNLKDSTLRSFYKLENWLTPEQADHILTVSDPLRQDLLALLGEFDAKIIVSGRYDVSRREPDRNDYYCWAFENLLQRAGLLARSLGTAGNTASSTTLVVDWPQAGTHKKLFDIYLGGFHFGRGLTTGQTYYSGSLKQLGFSESLTHGSTYHSGPLQLGDLVVGCCRDFLNWAYKGKKLGKIQGFFDHLIDRFYRDEKGRIDGCGFKVAKDHQINIEAKIREYEENSRRPVMAER